MNYYIFLFAAFFSAQLAMASEKKSESLVFEKTSNAAQNSSSNFDFYSRNSDFYSENQGFLQVALGPILFAEKPEMAFNEKKKSVLVGKDILLVFVNPALGLFSVNGKKFAYDIKENFAQNLKRSADVFFPKKRQESHSLEDLFVPRAFAADVAGLDWTQTFLESAPELLLYSAPVGAAGVGISALKMDGIVPNGAYQSWSKGWAQHGLVPPGIDPKKFYIAGNPSWTSGQNLMAPWKKVDAISKIIAATGLMYFATENAHAYLATPKCSEQVAEMKKLLESSGLALDSLVCQQPNITFKELSSGSRRSFTPYWRAGALIDGKNNEVYSFGYKDLKSVRRAESKVNNVEKKRIENGKAVSENVEEVETRIVEYVKGASLFAEREKEIEPFRKVLFYMGKNFSCKKCEREIILGLTSNASAGSRIRNAVLPPTEDGNENSGSKNATEVF